MNEDDKYNGKRGCAFILICLLVSIIIPCFFIFQLFNLNGLKSDILKMTGPMAFYSDEEILAVTKTIGVVRVSIVIEGFYFVILFCFFPLSRTIDSLKSLRKENIKAKIIYGIIFTVAITISIFIVFVNVQYFSEIIIKYYSIIFVLICAIPCHILGICFCVLIWSKFFDEIVLFFKFIINKLKKF